MLPRASAQNNPEKSSTPVPPTPTKDTKKAVIYVKSEKVLSPQKLHNQKQQQQSPQKIQHVPDSDSSAKESEDDDYDIPNPEGVSATDKAKLQRLQIRNLKRLREKVNKQNRFWSFMKIALQNIHHIL